MESFKYTLDKSSRKFICPKCHQKRFVLYLESESGKYLNDGYGKCDREQNCNYHKAPSKGKKCYLIEFLSIKHISDKAIRLTDLNGVISIVPKSQILEQKENSCWISEWYLKNSKIQYLTNENRYFKSKDLAILNIDLGISTNLKVAPSFHNLKLLDKMYLEQSDNLTKFLLSKFTIDEVKKASENYFITGTNHFWNDATVFWQIDENEKIRAGKIMLYKQTTGKRVKTPYNHINWIHKALKETEFSLSQCLFGLHRINEDHTKTVAIVESEKTAIVMSIILPEFIWLATGSKQNLKIEFLQPLKQRNIILFPDKGEYEHWNIKAAEFNLSGFKISASDLIERSDLQSGSDLVDLYSFEKIDT